MYGLIYVVTNTVNGKQYVGQTTLALSRRWQGHSKAVTNGSTYALHLAIRKYSTAAFKIEQIDSAETLEELNETEAHYISQLETLAPGGYNSTTGGEGHTVSYETRRKMSEAQIGKSFSVETCKKLSEASMNRKKTCCPRNHPLNQGNTHIDFRGSRHCLVCWYLNHGRKLPQKLKKYTIKEKVAQYE